MTKKLLIAIVALGVLGLVWFLFTQQVAPQSVPSSTSTSRPTATVGPTSTAITRWETYTNTKYRFLFQYPPDWSVDDQSYTYGGQDYMRALVDSPSFKGVPGATRDSVFEIAMYFEHCSSQPTSTQNACQIGWTHQESIHLTLLSSDGGEILVAVSQQYLQSTAQYETSQQIWQSLSVHG